MTANMISNLFFLFLRLSISERAVCTEHNLKTLFVLKSIAARWFVKKIFHSAFSNRLFFDETRPLTEAADRSLWSIGSDRSTMFFNLHHSENDKKRVSNDYKTFVNIGSLEQRQNA